MLTPEQQKQGYILLAKQIAGQFKLDASLVCAVCEQESGWNPWAMRYEPAFFTKYVAPLYVNNKISATEAYARGFSWGLMQVMGEVARENGVGLAFLSQLCDPELGIKMGCKVLAEKLERAKGDVRQGLLNWNGGAMLGYPDAVMLKQAKYK